jgi:hypothetical protein
MFLNLAIQQNALFGNCELLCTFCPQSWDQSKREKPREHFKEPLPSMYRIFHMTTPSGVTDWQFIEACR